MHIPVRVAPLRTASAVALLVSLLAGLVVLVAVAPPSEATHFRASQLSWHTTSTPREVEFHFTAAFRRSFFTAQGYPATVGSTVLIQTAAGAGLAFGDGANLLSFNATVVQRDDPNDTLVVEAHIPHTYAGTATQFLAFYENCCRLSPPPHRNNPDKPTRQETIVSLVPGVTGSPTSAISPIVDCPLNGLCQFLVPALDADGATLALRLATPQEAAGTSGTGGPYVHPTSATSAGISAAGVYSWNTTGAFLFAAPSATFYSTQVIITKSLGGVQVSKTAVDFFIRLTSAASANQPPVFTAPTPADGTTFNPGVGQAVSFTVRATDPNPANTVTLGTLALPIGASLTATPGNPAEGTFTFTPTGAGDQAIVFTAQDEFGLQATQRTVLINVDDAAPVVSVPAPQVVEATGPNGAIAAYPAATATDDVDGPLTPTCTPASGGQFALGTTTVTCGATDAAGNTGSADFTVTVADSTGPALSLFDLTAEATSAAGAVVTYTAAADDLVDGPTSVACSPVSGSLFALGANTVSCSSTDAAGNTSNGAFTILVQDTTAPVLLVPGDILAEATGPTGADISYTASASDSVDGTVPTSCSPASGTFGLGTTGVLCSASDAAGNSASDDFLVTVRDTTPPTLVLPTSFTVEATAADGADVGYTATAEDLVDGTVATPCTPVPGHFPIGVTTVSCSSTDAAGNTSTGSFEVTVGDTTAPIVSPPANQIVEATGPTGADATFSAGAVDAVDGVLAPTCSPAAGSTFALGTTTVTCSATDAAGNTGSATFEVTVQDTTAPVLAAADVVAEATGPGGAAVTLPAVEGTDLVDGTVPGSCDAASGDTFALGATTVSCSATDAAGNTGVTSFVVTVVDTTKPVVSYTGNQGTYGVHQVIAITCATADAVGVVSHTCADVNGAAAGFATGDHTVSATATDAAGNTGTGSTTFRVAVTSADLCALTQQYVTKEGVAHALCVKLAHAQDKADRGNHNGASAELRNYRNQVAAQSGKSMTAEQAATLDRLAALLAESL